LLAEQFHAAAASARTLAQIEDVSRLLWRAHAEGHFTDDAAAALSEAVEAKGQSAHRTGCRTAQAVLNALLSDAKRPTRISDQS
jgi:hypothetical protein